MQTLLDAQLQASSCLQEGEEALSRFIGEFMKTYNGDESMERALLHFKSYCISQGRLEGLLENTLKDDTKNTQEKG